METLPEYLKVAREALNYDLSEASKVTNISEKFLVALESGTYHKLPADVYVYGFLRKLAELYRTNAELLIEQYKKERGIAEQLSKKIPTYKSYTDQKFVLTPKTITLSVLVVFIIFVLGYLFFQVHAINQPPKIHITSPKDGERITASSVIVQGQTDIGTSLSMNDQQIFVDSEGNFKQPVSISQGEKVLTFVASNNFGKQSTKQILIIGDFPADVRSSTAQKDNPLSLTVEIGPNSTWLRIVIDNNPALDETFIAGSSKTYIAKNRIVLSTGDAGSTSVKLNNKNLGKLGRDGEVLRDIPFTADSVNTK